MANHTIVLHVNTSSIPASPTTAALIDANCSFGQNKTTTSNEAFNIDVVNNDTVTWYGVSSSNTNDIVYVTEIDYESGQHLFGNHNLTPASVGVSIVGTVQNAGTEGLIEQYKIKFSVFKHGSAPGPGHEYEIDPKLTISSGGER